MKELVLIYHFETSQNKNDEFKPASYKILYIFNADGMIDDKRIAEFINANAESFSLDQSFSNLDDLKSFSLHLSQYFERNEVRLISVQDYNIGIDGAKDRHSFVQIFSNFGEVFVDESKPKKKGFFGNFF
jgi:hypothetical protein